MAPSLASLFRSESSLEQFIGAALYAGGVWPSPRHGDGLLDCHAVDGGDGVLRMRGRLVTIDQQLHVFWLEVSDVADLGWTLYFDTPTSPRAANAFAFPEHAEDVTWSVILDGHVELDGDVPVPVVDPVSKA